MTRIVCFHSDVDFGVTTHLLPAMSVKDAVVAELHGVEGVQNRGFGLEVSDLRSGLDANECVEMGEHVFGS